MRRCRDEVQETEPMRNQILAVLEDVCHGTSIPDCMKCSHGLVDVIHDHHEMTRYVPDLIPNLERLDEFEEVLKDVAADLVFANHISAEEMASTPIKDLVPAIVWERPRDQAA